MSTSKLDRSGVFATQEHRASQTKLLLPAGEIQFRKNGIEFSHPGPIPLWTEMDVEIYSPLGHHLSATGVVVSCAGSCAASCLISMILMRLTPQASDQLSLLALLNVV